MKQFYTTVNEIVQNQWNALKAFTKRYNEIIGSTASQERKDADKKTLENECMATGKANYEAFMEAVKLKKSQLPAQLNTWKHASDPALTNILLVLGTGNKISGDQILAMAETFKDDYISIEAIKAAAQSAGINELSIAPLRSHLGDRPERILEAYEQRAYRAFLSNPHTPGVALGQLLEYTAKALAGEDISYVVQPYADVL